MQRELYFFTLRCCVFLNNLRDKISMTVSIITKRPKNNNNRNIFSTVIT